MVSGRKSAGSGALPVSYFTLKDISRLQIGAVLMVLAGVVGLVYYFLGPHKISDRKKYERILTLYMSQQAEFPDVQDVSPREAMELFNTGKVIFIDVRQATEQNISRLRGAITMDYFLNHLETYNDFIKIGYDTIGYRSGIFAQGLYQEGILLYNLRGGLLAWVHAGGIIYNGDNETRRIHVYRREWDLVPDHYESLR